MIWLLLVLKYKFRLKKILLFISLIIITHTLLFSQKDSSEIFIYANKTPLIKTLSAKKLSKYLTSKYTNELDKVHSIHAWITEKIKYDVDKIIKHTNETYSAKQILRRRKATCIEYATLFNELCKAANIKSYTVNGYDKGTGYLKGDIFIIAEHAWNVVKINDKWNLIDIGWDSGFLRYDEQKSKELLHKYFNLPVIHNKLVFVKNPIKKYFLSSPSEFVKTHLPCNPMWQLLDNPIDLETFETRPETIDANIKHYEKSNYIGYNYSDSIKNYLSLRANLKALYLAKDANLFNYNNNRVVAQNYINYSELTITHPRGDENEKLDELKKSLSYLMISKEYIKKLIKQNKNLNTENTQKNNKLKKKTFSNNKSLLSENSKIIRINTKRINKLIQKNKILHDKNNELSKRNKALSKKGISDIKRPEKFPDNKKIATIKNNINTIENNDLNIKRTTSINDSIWNSSNIIRKEVIFTNNNILFERLEKSNTLLEICIDLGTEADPLNYKAIEKNKLEITKLYTKNRKSRKTIEDDKEIISKENNKLLKENNKHIEKLIKINKRLIIKNLKLYPKDEDEDNLYLISNNKMITKNEERQITNSKDIANNKLEIVDLKKEIIALEKISKLLKYENEIEQLRYIKFKNIEKLRNNSLKNECKLLSKKSNITISENKKQIKIFEKLVKERIANNL